MRFQAIDVLRGITVTLMIIVNSPGNHETTFAPLLHADWHGFTPTDWVFPTFLFVVGNAMCFSLTSSLAAGARTYFYKVVKRASVIFLLGFLMYWFPFVQQIDGQWALKPLAETRIFGVLQRIALCYLFASVLIYFIKEKGLLIFSAVALVGYWLLLLSFGDLSLQGNAVLKLDMWLLGSKHLYLGEGLPFDPEGLLSTLPAIVNVVGGYLVGKYIKERGVTFETIAKLLMAGVLLATIGLVWNWGFPINKKLWTSSFVLYTVGLDVIILSLLLYVIEIRKINRWTYFFEVFGKNTLFLYLISEIGLTIFWIFNIGDKPIYQFLFTDVFSPLAGDYLGSFLFAFTWMMTCWTIGYCMDKKKIYIKV
jgi:predicted acyltransferase